MTRTTLSDQVAEAILADIKERGLRAGDEIAAEGEIATRHGVNRLAVREAIRTLVAREILVSSQGRRARVAVPSPVVLQQLLEFRLSQDSWDARDLIETRRLIEGELARRAASRAAGGADLGRLDRAVAAMEATTDDRERFVVDDLEFHLAIAELADSPMLSFLLTAMNGVLLDAFRASYEGHDRRGEDRAAVVAAHRSIRDAIAGGDPDQAGRVMSEHLDATAADLGL